MRGREPVGHASRMRLPAFGFCSVLLGLIPFQPVAADAGGKFMIITSPKQKNVFFARLQTAAEITQKKPMKVFPLTTAGDLKEPRGCATDNQRLLVYVADPGSSAIVQIQVFLSNEDGGKLVLGGKKPKKVVSGVESKWVAVDAVGNVFFTQAMSNQISYIPGSGLQQQLRGEPVSLKHVVLYSAVGPPAIASIIKPQGIAADNFNVYWANGEAGTAQGTVLRGLEQPSAKDKVRDITLMAGNADAAYGICLAGNSIFYTDATANVFAMRRSGGTTATITDKLEAPRGCVWDGDGTVFVADRHGNQIYSFAGDTPSLEPRNLKPAIKIEDPYGLAVLSGVRMQATISHLCFALIGLVYYFWL